MAATSPGAFAREISSLSSGRVFHRSVKKLVEILGYTSDKQLTVMELSRFALFWFNVNYRLEIT
jgi:hypothetical protein